MAAIFAAIFMMTLSAAPPAVQGSDFCSWGMVVLSLRGSYSVLEASSLRSYLTAPRRTSSWCHQAGGVALGRGATSLNVVWKRIQSLLPADSGLSETLGELCSPFFLSVIPLDVGFSYPQDR